MATAAVFYPQVGGGIEEKSSNALHTKGFGERVTAGDSDDSGDSAKKKRCHRQNR